MNIKVKAWDKINKCWETNLKWEECGAHAEYDSGVLTLKSNEYYEWVMFTGLHDKNGKEIYESDIIEWIGERYVFGYSALKRGKYEVRLDLVAGFWLEGYYDTSYCKIRGFTNNFEVIGNIYENENILKQK